MDLSTSLGILAELQAEEGEKGAALASIIEALRLRERLPSTSPVDPYNTACFYIIYSRLTDDAPSSHKGGLSRQECQDQAMAALRRAFENGYHQAEKVRKAPDFAPLASRPDFQELLRDMSFPADPFAHPAAGGKHGP
jgi:hypothetical protein